MSNEPFTREPGWEYQQAGDFPMRMRGTWERFEQGSCLWFAHAGFHPSHYHPDCWFRLRLPAAPLADGWVKFSEREPRPDEYPIWILTKSRDIQLLHAQSVRRIWEDATEWLPIVRPAPPQAPSQEERDRRAYRAWEAEYRGGTMTIASNAFHAGVRHARGDK